MESSPKPSPSPRERLDSLKIELESARATTNQWKWVSLNNEIQDLREELTEDLQTGFKDVANTTGNLGQRLCKLEKQAEELVKAISKISDAAAEAISKIS